MCFTAWWLLYVPPALGTRDILVRSAELTAVISRNRYNSFFVLKDKEGYL